MPRFLSISIVMLLLASCAGPKRLAKDVGLESFISQSPQGLIYKSGFNFKEYYFSGIMVIKPENENIRIQFLSELGPTIIDFSLGKKNMEVLKMIESLDKNVFMTQMEYDLRLLLQANLFYNGTVKNKGSKSGLQKYKLGGKENFVIFLNEETGQVERGFRRGIGYDKVNVRYEYEDQNPVPKTIMLSHKMIDIKLKLSRLK